MKINYKEGKKLELLFDEQDVGDDEWCFLSLIKVLKSLGWRDINLTNRDFGMIDRIYKELENAGVNFESKCLTDVGELDVTEDAKKDIKTLIEKLDEISKQLSRLEPNLSITFKK